MPAVAAEVVGRRCPGLGRAAVRGDPSDILGQVRTKSGRERKLDRSKLGKRAQVDGRLFKNARICKAKLGFVNLWRLTC